MFSRQKIAAGHDNEASLKAFPEIAPPLFAVHVRALPQVWRGYVGKALTGRRTDRTWGRPAVTLTFGSLTRDELVLLQTYVGLVTVYVLNEDINQWAAYNATLRQFTPGDFAKRGNRYTEVRIECIDLKAI